MPRLEEPVPADVRIGFVPRQQFALSANRFVDDERRVVRGQERIRSPLLRPPTELARQVARVHGGGHLGAAGALDSGEFPLLANDAFGGGPALLVVTFVRTV